jgi:hypothetical protein
MTADNSTKRFGNIEITFDQDCDDVVSAALAMLAYGLSGLSADEREEWRRLPAAPGTDRHSQRGSGSMSFGR